jgi:hypothetical protein
MSNSRDGSKKLSLVVMVVMLGLVAICWSIWKEQNKTCFDKKTY